MRYVFAIAVLLSLPAWGSHGAARRPPLPTTASVPVPVNNILSEDEVNTWVDDAAPLVGEYFKAQEFLRALKTMSLVAGIPVRHLMVVATHLLHRGRDETTVRMLLLALSDLVDRSITNAFFDAATFVCSALDREVASKAELDAVRIATGGRLTRETLLSGAVARLHKSKDALSRWLRDPNHVGYVIQEGVVGAALKIDGAIPGPDRGKLGARAKQLSGYQFSEGAAGLGAREF